MSSAEIASSPANAVAAVSRHSWKSFKLLIASNIFFILATVFLFLGETLEYSNIAAPPGTEKAAQIMATAGASCFIVTGTLDYINSRKLLHCFMIFAGAFGTAAAALKNSNITAYRVCKLISAHLFLLESLQWIYGHFMQTDLDKNDSRKKSLMVAEFGDFCFFVGAFMDVIISYTYFGKSPGQESSPVSAFGEIASDVFWMISAFVATGVSCKLGKQGFSGESLPVSIQANPAATMS